MLGKTHRMFKTRALQSGTFPHDMKYGGEYAFFFRNVHKMKETKLFAGNLGLYYAYGGQCRQVIDNVNI